MLTEKDIEQFILDAYKKRLEDPTVIPDIKVFESATQFMMTLYSGKTILRTGIGGLKLFLNMIGALVFLKVEYNGVILTKEQTELFLKRIEEYEYKSKETDRT